MGRMRSIWGSSKIKERVRTVQPPSDLIRAIQERKIVTYMYDGYYREIEPHACGVFDNGRTALIGYQVGGQSKSDSDPPWRNFSVEKMQNLTVTDRVFLNNRPDYNPDDRRLSPVYAKV